LHGDLAIEANPKWQAQPTDVEVPAPELYRGEAGDGAAGLMPQVIGACYIENLLAQPG
jgi:hypothetical protein